MLVRANVYASGVCVRVCVLSSLGEEDEQRSKVRAHKAALKVIRVIPALGSSCSFPLPREPLNKMYTHIRHGTVHSKSTTTHCHFFFSF